MYIMLVLILEAVNRGVKPRPPSYSVFGYATSNEGAVSQGVKSRSPNVAFYAGSNVGAVSQGGHTAVS